jgi:hypothetical protein
MILGMGLTFTVVATLAAVAAAGRSRPTNMAAMRRSRFWLCSVSRSSFPNCPTG